MRRILPWFFILVLFLLASVAANAQCTGGTGSPFNCPAPSRTLTTSDLVVGGQLAPNTTVRIAIGTLLSIPGSTYYMPKVGGALSGATITTSQINSSPIGGMAAAAGNFTALGAATSFALPCWTTSGRPGSPSQGWLGCNTTTNAPDYYTGSGWISLGVGGGGGALIINSTAITGSAASNALVSDGTKLQQIPYGLTGNSTLIVTTSGGLLTPSILPLATTGAFGAVKCDGSTITCTGGTITSIAGGASNLPVINAAQAPYSVACNGSTNDTSAIQAAINAAGGNAATIVMPAGTCLVTGGLTIATNGINFIGQGGGNGPGTGTAIVTNQAAGNVIQIGSTSANVSGVTIQGISISSSVTRTGGAGIYRYSGAWNVLRDVKIYNMWQGYVVDGRTAPSGSGNSDYDNYVYGGSFNANSHGGIVVGVSGNTTANNFPENEFFYSPDVSANGVGGLILNDCGGCNLSGVQGILNDVGVLVSPGSNQAVGVFSTDLQLDSSKNAALAFEATGTGTFQGQWSNSWLTSSGTSPISGGVYLNPLAVGIRFDSAVSAYGALTFVGGKIYNNAGPGVYEAQNPKYVTFTGVDNYSNSAYNNGASVCPTSTPACNNNNVYPNYLATNGTTNMSAIGGNWGVGAGLLNWPSYGYDIGGGSFTDVALVGINVNGTASSGTCVIGGTTLTGGIRCGGSTASVQAGIVGVTVSGGAGTGNVSNTTGGGSGGNVMTCVTAPACTNIATSSYTLNSGGMAFPGGTTVGTGGNGFSGLVSVNNPSWAGLISGTVAAGSYLGLNGSGQVVLGSPAGGGTVTTAGGSTGNIANCNNGGCTQIVGTSFGLNGSGIAFPGSATVGTVGNGISGLVSVNNPSWTGLISGTIAGGSFMGLNGSGQVVLGTPAGGGNVSNSTTGSGGAIMTCAAPTACTTVAPSSALVNGGAQALQLPNGWAFTVNGTPAVLGNSGTWAPLLTGGGVGVPSYTRQVGTYQVMGKFVVASFSVVVSSVAGIGSTPIVVTMPVAANGSTGYGSCSIGFYNNTSGVSNSVFGEVTPGTSSAILFTGAASAAVELSNANVTSTSQFDGTCTYPL